MSASVVLRSVPRAATFWQQGGRHVGTVQPDERPLPLATATHAGWASGGARLLPLPSFQGSLICESLGGLLLSPSSEHPYLIHIPSHAHPPFFPPHKHTALCQTPSVSPAFCFLSTSHHSPSAPGGSMPRDKRGFLPETGITADSPLSAPGSRVNTPCSSC